MLGVGTAPVSFNELRGLAVDGGGAMFVAAPVLGIGAAVGTVGATAPDENRDSDHEPNKA